jgi:RHS repeat-associated protein
MLDENADLNWYDYAFRNYDPQIGRFPQLDPLADNFPFLTPYQYATNDPITNIDMDGLEGCPAVAGLVGYVGNLGSAFSAGSSIVNGIEAVFRISSVTSTTLSVLSLTGNVVETSSQKEIINESTSSSAINKEFQTNGVGNNAPRPESNGSGPPDLENDPDAPSDMQVSQDYFDFVKSAEGPGLKIYYDNAKPKRNLTGGWGHKLTPDELKTYKKGDPVTPDQRNKWFAADIGTFENGINNAVKGIKLTQFQFDALVNLAYNIGHVPSTVLAYVKKGNFVEASLEFNRLNRHADKGIDVRRANEQRLFDSGNYKYKFGIHTWFWDYIKNVKNSFRRSKNYDPHLWNKFKMAEYGD